MLAYHNLAFMLSYNSGRNYLNYTLNYAFQKYRPTFYAQFSGYMQDELTNSLNLEYDERRFAEIFGLSYPLDRHNRIDCLTLFRNERDMYSTGQKDITKTRAFQISYRRDTKNGVYLTANRGSVLELSQLKALEKWGGNESYDAYLLELIKYFPLSKTSTLVGRLFGKVSGGKNNLTFDFRGIGGVRGFQRGLDKNKTRRIIFGNLELRTPVIKDINYYMWYMFPDFYFKTVYFKFFIDSGYGFDKSDEIRNWKISDLSASIGFGFNIYTFVLQTFKMVLSFDYAFRTSDGGKIFYFYFGPLF